MNRPRSRARSTGAFPRQAGAFQTPGRRSRGSIATLFIPPLASPAEGGGSALQSVEHRDRPLHTTQSTFAGLPADRRLDRMSTRFSLYPCQAVNKRGRIDPDRRPQRSQPIPSKPGKVVVQMVVYLPSPLT